MKYAYLTDYFEKIGGHISQKYSLGCPSLTHVRVQIAAVKIHTTSGLVLEEIELACHTNPRSQRNRLILIMRDEEQACG